MEMSEAPALLAALPEEARERVGSLLPALESEPKVQPAAASEESLAPTALTPGWKAKKGTVISINRCRKLGSDNLDVRASFLE